MVFGATGSGEFDTDVRQVFPKQVSVLGDGDGKPEGVRCRLLDAGEPGKLRSCRQRPPTCRDCRRHERIENASHFGKLVLEIAWTPSRRGEPAPAPAASPTRRLAT